MSNAVYDTHLININKLKLKRKATSSPPIPYLLKPNQSFIKNHVSPFICVSI